jgi:Zn-finger protein
MRRRVRKVNSVDCQDCDIAFCPYYEVLLCSVDWNETILTVFKANDSTFKANDSTFKANDSTFKAN